MATVQRVIAALLFACCIPAYAATCPDLQISLQATIDGYISANNAALASCLSTSPPGVCGSRNPGGTVETQVVSGVTQKRYKVWKTGTPDAGSVVETSYGPWTTCTATPAEQADCNAIADALNYLKKPLIHYGPVALTACYGGFVIGGSGGAGGGGQSELYGPFSCSGSSASTCSVTPKPSSIEVTCKEGEYPGMVNGVQVCVPPSSSVEAPKQTTATPPSPGASAPQIPDAPPGTASQSEQTTCTGSNCTTTTTYKDANGNPTGSKTQEQSKASYCAENPKAPGCAQEEKSAFGGNCSGGFVGSGDALQKATAEAVNRTNCLLDPGTATDGVKAQLEAGTFAEALPVKAKSVAQFDQTNPYGGSCPGDIVVSLGVLGSHSIPLSGMCIYLQLLGYIALGVTLVSSTIFVVKGFD